MGSVIFFQVFFYKAADYRMLYNILLKYSSNLLQQIHYLFSKSLADLGFSPLNASCNMNVSNQVWGAPAPPIS